MNQHEIATACRRYVSDVISIAGDRISPLWKDIIDDFAKLNDKQCRTIRTLRKRFRKYVMANISNEGQIGLFKTAVMQNHHDFYIALYNKKRGFLNPDEKTQYKLAKDREAIGFCQPLPADK